MAGNARRPWSPDEDAYLRDHYGLLLGREIAAALDRPLAGVYNRANEIGLRRPLQARTQWTPERNELLRAAWGTVPTKRLAAELGTTVNGVRCQAKHLGLLHAENAAQRALRDGRRIARLRILLAAVVGTLSPMDAAARLGCRPEQVRRLALAEAAAATEGHATATERHATAPATTETRPHKPEAKTRAMASHGHGEARNDLRNLSGHGVAEAQRREGAA